MFKLLLIFPALIVGSVLLGVGAIAIVPIVALLPFILAIGASFLAFSLAASVLVLFARIVGALIIGVGGLMVAGVGTVALFAGGFVALLLGFALFHLALPVLFVVALVWLIHRASRPKSAQLVHG